MKPFAFTKNEPPLRELTEAEIALVAGGPPPLSDDTLCEGVTFFIKSDGSTGTRRDQLQDST